MRSTTSRITRFAALFGLICAPLAFLVVLETPVGATQVGNAAALRTAYELGSTTQIDLTGPITITAPSVADCPEMIRNSNVDLVIDGHGFTISKDPNCNHRIFRQDGVGALTFRNVTLTGGNEPGGPGGAVDSQGTVTIVDSTITANKAQSLGGGIFSATTVTVTNSTVSKNHADDAGGGIYSDANVHVSGSTISGNDATFDGGCQCSGGGFVALGGTDVTNSTITDNHAGCDGLCGADGGGFLSEGSTSVSGSTVSNNEVHCSSECDSTGGGFVGGGVSVFSAGPAAQVVAEPGEVVVDHSTISGNTIGSCDLCEGDGGGFYAHGATGVSVNATTLNDNTAAFGGGAFSVGGACGPGTPTVVVNSTVTGNTSSGAAAIDVAGPCDTLTTVYDTIDSNTWVSPANLSVQAVADAANISAEVYESFGTVVTNPIGAVNCQIFDPPVGSDGYNFSDDDSCLFLASTDTEASTNDPVLGALADNGGGTDTLLPLVGSPLIDGIPTAACGDGDSAAGFAVTVDQRGITRPQINGCDIGAVEVVGASIQVTKVVSGTNGHTVPSTGYTFAVSCTDGTTGTLTVADATNGGTSGVIKQILPGATCSVTEAAVVYTNATVSGQPVVTYLPVNPGPKLGDGQLETVIVTNDYALVNLLGATVTPAPAPAPAPIPEIQPAFTG